MEGLKVSDYEKIKAIRYPITKEQKENFYNIEREIENDGFAVAPTYPECFLDYILKNEYGSEAGDYGKVRELSEREKEKYKAKFEKYIQDFDANKLRLVEYCFYNGCEAPSYYNDETYHDSFFDEV